MFAAGELAAQGRLMVPPRVMEIDLSEQNRRVKRSFSRRGMGLSTPLEFFFLKHDRVAIVAEPPAVDGVFEVTANNDKPWIKIEVSPTRAGGKLRAEVIRTVRIVSQQQMAASARNKSLKMAMDAFGKQATAAAEAAPERQLRSYLRTKARPFEDDTPLKTLRKLYTEERAKELAVDIYRKDIADIATAHPMWFTPRQVSELETLDAVDVPRRHVELLFYALSDAYLKDEAGLTFDTDHLHYSETIARKLEAVYLFTSGETVDDKEAASFASKWLSQEDRAKISDGLKLSLKCSFYPSAPEQDPNAQWFAAQKVSCSGSRIASVTLRGELDPAGGDSVDWFELLNFDAAVKIRPPEDPAVTVDLPPYRHNDRVFLRVHSRKKASYALQITPARPGRTHNVILHETPVQSTARFPF